MKKKRGLIPLALLVMLIISSFVLYQKLVSPEILSQISQIKQPQKNNQNVQMINDEKFNIHFKDAQGQSYQLKDFAGKPIVLNFWVSWCPPCREEMPLFQQVYAQDNSIEFILVNQTDGQQETKETAEKFIADYALTMPVYFDDDFDSATKYNITALPHTVFIDRNGKIVSIVSGGLTKEMLEQHLAAIKQ